MTAEEPRRVKVVYLGLVRNVLDCPEEVAEVGDRTTVGQLLEQLASRHGDPFRWSVFKGNGELRSTVLICMNDSDVSQLSGLETQLEAGAQLTVIVGVYPPEGG
ncbi:MAG: MoaD/ThiS family protein [Candidatus Tectomicrobia bacterium]|uniref:MoaD/ThiS family protein n=1 Tax=Tectimicrobiota bacterium TaxID=2528274 RepID=A0A932GRB6_UNCTE|nr:MoaD/ThiS family protein [Candidatus Tectomicrobia bacterium]